MYENNFISERIPEKAAIVTTCNQEALLWNSLPVNSRTLTAEITFEKRAKAASAVDAAPFGSAVASAAAGSDPRL